MTRSKLKSNKLSSNDKIDKNRKEEAAAANTLATYRTGTSSTDSGPEESAVVTNESDPYIDIVETRATSISANKEIINLSSNQTRNTNGYLFSKNSLSYESNISFIKGGSLYYGNQSSNANKTYLPELTQYNTSQASDNLYAYAEGSSNLLNKPEISTIITSPITPTASSTNTLALVLKNQNLYMSIWRPNTIEAYLNKPTPRNVLGSQGSSELHRYKAGTNGFPNQSETVNSVNHPLEPDQGTDIMAFNNVSSRVKLNTANLYGKDTQALQFQNGDKKTPSRFSLSTNTTTQASTSVQTRATQLPEVPLRYNHVSTEPNASPSGANSNIQQFLNSNLTYENELKMLKKMLSKGTEHASINFKNIAIDKFLRLHNTHYIRMLSLRESEILISILFEEVSHCSYQKCDSMLFLILQSTQIFKLSSTDLWIRHLTTVIKNLTPAIWIKIIPKVFKSFFKVYVNKVIDINLLKLIEALKHAYENQNDWSDRLLLRLAAAGCMKYIRVTIGEWRFRSVLSTVPQEISQAVYSMSI